MPAYFSLIFELNKSATAIRDFCTALLDAGLVFKSGCWDSENDSFDDIIEYNQSKLNDNFKLGYKEDFSQDYKEILFDYRDFSGIWLSVDNNKRSKRFYFCLFVPEDDFLYYEDEELDVEEIIKRGRPPQKRYDRMELIKELAIKIWEASETLAIQTSWEISDLAPAFYEIEKGALPQFEPFCIIPRSLMRKKWRLNGNSIAKGGILIEQKEKWYNLFFDVDQWVKYDPLPDA